ncbi:metallophosphoesterase, partial [bacterium]|nr:metallophosphoesterase [bacterium]
MNRRHFLAKTAATSAGIAGTGARGGARKTFRLWAMGCAHVGTDWRHGRRESLADAIRQSESGGKEGGPPFAWDMALHLGDLSGTQTRPDDAEGRLVVRQFAAAKTHRREHFYNLVGNHDACGRGERTQWWFRKWVDPTGENTEFSRVRADRRPYPIKGTWERYAIRVGNLLLLMMGDRNDLDPPIGRGPRGGYPAGAVTGETFAWWRRAVEAN